MHVLYQIELDDPRGVQSRVFTLEADWPFPSLPSKGDGVAIDYDYGGMSVEQTGAGGFVMTPTPGRRLNAMMVDRVFYRPGAGYAAIHLVVDTTFEHDPKPQIDALLEAGFREQT
jgi:hypothetical protein